MTGYDLYKRTMILLGYIGDNETLNDGEIFQKRALDAVNEIGNDLYGMKPIGDLFEETDMSERTAIAAVYGIAMILAMGAGDREKNRLFCELYNKARASVKAENRKIVDKLPIASEG